MVNSHRIRTISVAAAAFALVGSTTAAALPLEDDGFVSPSVIGGEELTDISQNPGAVGLHVKVDDPNNTGLICGATRIAPKWVLTAKHCVIEHQKKYELESVSSYTIDRRYGPKITFDSSKVVFHPSSTVDVALLPLDEAGPGMIATYTDRTPRKGDTLVTMGWGNTSMSGVDTTVLKKANASVLAIQDAKGKAPANYDGGDHIFTKGVNGRCWQGDSGGPLFDENNQLIGVTSWADRPMTDTDINGRCGYVHMAYITDWIKQHTQVSPGTAFDTIPMPDGSTPGEPAPEDPRPEDPTPEDPNPEQPLPFPDDEFTLPVFP